MSIQTKTCTKCDETKALSAFSTQKQGKYGVTSRCRDCCATLSKERRLANYESYLAREKAWRQANKEKSNATIAAWAKRNTERRAVAQRKRYAEKRERILKQNAAWYVENKERRNAKSAEWERQNRGARRRYTAARKAARLRATPVWADMDAIAAVYAEAQAMAALGLDVHVDHFYPLQGVDVCGLHVASNLRVILAEDNLRKSNKLVEVCGA